MTVALFFLVLAVTWMAVTGSFSFANLVLGGAIAALALWFLRAQLAEPKLMRKLGQVIGLIGLFLYELALSAIRVAILVITPDLKKVLQPAIVAFPLTAKSDAEITLLANLITLTPGTLSVDVSEDRRFIYVHAISAPDRAALIADIAKGFESRIIEVFA